MPICYNLHQKESHMRIAVVEDDSRHMREAIGFLESQGVEVVTATNYDAFETNIFIPHNIRKQLLDGVITDLYFPGKNYPPYNNADVPYGLTVATVCRHKGIPCVICTSGHHHGHKVEFVMKMTDRGDWPEIVFGTIPLIREGRGAKAWEDEAEQKDWPVALEKLRELILQNQK